MGVMLCSRKHCPNIMCDTYIPQVGYICNNCEEEFKSTIQEELTQQEVITKLEEFMSSSKMKEYSPEKMSVDKFFNNYRH